MNSQALQKSGSMISVHLKKLRQRVSLNAAEEAAIRGLVAETRRVAADETLVHEGQPLNESLLLLSGWLARIKDLTAGERQVTELHVPGDFADLHGFTLKRLDHDLVAFTECEIGAVPHERIRKLTDDFPRLARVYWLMTNIDASIHREWTLSLGQRSALSRMAHLFCELHVRLRVVDGTSDLAYPFPLTQRELAECMGLTVVHANRTLQELRRRSLIELESRRLRILDIKELEALAEFDPSYLYLERHEL